MSDQNVLVCPECGSTVFTVHRDELYCCSCGMREPDPDFGPVSVKREDIERAPWRDARGAHKLRDLSL
jgi:hypothetical protein